MSTPAVALQGAPSLALAAVDAVLGAVATLEADGDIMSLVEIQATTNAALSEVKAVMALLENYTVAPAYALGAALIAAGAALSRYAEALAETKPPLITEVLKSDWSLLELAHALYGDSTRAGELLLLNVDVIDDPLLILSGTELRRYAV